MDNAPVVMADSGHFNSEWIVVYLLQLVSGEKRKGRKERWFMGMTKNNSSHVLALRSKISDGFK